ncbi:nucleotidyltransferase family protein [Sphingomonas sp. BGYR3]|uniref:nucleotidyltransferase family protein n=1 Tax=Sphingomonas sp. BGYR3 TaxID=2975483 RepID=UPI0021A3883F|nr:nucleotidyltransferase family protein [Sphingomonas sp. BGYR3]
MPDPRIANSALILLAAGLSQRFGAADKLTAMLEGRPLIRHAADRLGAMPFGWRIAVTGHPVPVLPGWRCVPNPEPAAGQGRSLAIGVAEADTLGAEAVVIALADMPRVTAAQVEALFSVLDERGMAAMAGPGGPMPPALFTRPHFAALTRLSGDRGGRALLADAALVTAPPATLVDVDTPEALARLSAP